MKLIHPEVVSIDPNVYGRLSYEKRKPIEIVHELSSVSSTNAKVEILKKAFHNESFLAGVRLALDPLVKFWIRKIPDYIPAKASAYSCIRILNQLSVILCKRQVTGNAAIAKVREFLEISEPDDAEFVAKVLSKDLDCGVNVGLVNSAWKKCDLYDKKDLIKEFPVMLCTAFDRYALERLNFPAYVQTKMDGMRIGAVIHPGGVITYHTRNGNTLEDIPTNVNSDISRLFGAYSSTGVVLDGEMVVMEPDGSLSPRKKSNGVMTRLIRGTSSESDRESVHFFIWDLIDFNVFNGTHPSKKEYGQRFTDLTAIWINNPALPQDTSIHIHRVKSTLVSNHLDAMKLFNQELADGNEGVIVKSIFNRWSFTRAKDQIKIKAELEMDAKIVDVIEGTGKYEGMLGSFVCEAIDDNGKIIFNVGSGFTDDERKTFWDEKPIGGTANVKYNEIITSSDGSRSLFLPIFVEVRSDIGPL